MTLPIHVALIGYGLAGKVFHAPVIQAVPGLRLVTIQSSQPQKVRADCPEVWVSASFEEVIQAPQIDLVVIATPNHTHFELARRALEAGKHVVVDKPFTLWAQEARALAELAQAQKRLLSVFQNRRWDGDFLSLQRVLEAGTLGEVVYFESHFDRYRPAVQPRWREQAGPGSGIWYDLGPHLADQALLLFGWPQAVFADIAFQRLGAEAPDYFHVLLATPGCGWCCMPVPWYLGAVRALWYTAPRAVGCAMASIRKKSLFGKACIREGQAGGRLEARPGSTGPVSPPSC